MTESPKRVQREHLSKELPQRFKSDNNIPKESKIKCHR
jgi:hypothetical protein